MDHPHNTEESRKKRESKKRKRIQYIKRLHFRHYIHRVFEAFDADESLSRQAIEVMDSIVCGVFHELASQAKELKVYSGRRTLMVSDIINAAKLYFKGQLATFAVENGLAAVRQYTEMTRRR